MSAAATPNRPTLGLRGSTTMDASGPWSRVGDWSVTDALTSAPGGASDEDDISHGFTVGDVLG
ncbi:MAG: hypothetical protein EXR69_12765, partial [Myxococcales bacterium]|nr:hypothetical protein [Myxococcales bacterium]